MPPARRKPIRRNQTQPNQIGEIETEEGEENIETIEDEETNEDTEIDGEETEPDDDSSDDDAEPAEEVEAEPLERMVGAPRDGMTYRVGETVFFQGEKRGGMITVTQPVYRGVKSPGTDRWRFHLLLGKGAQVPASRCKELEDGKFESRTDLVH